MSKMIFLQTVAIISFAAFQNNASFSMEPDHSVPDIDIGQLSASRKEQNWEYIQPSPWERICNGVSSFFSTNDEIPYDDQRSTPDAEKSLEEYMTRGTNCYRPEHIPQPDFSSPYDYDDIYDDTKYGPWQTNELGMPFRERLIDGKQSVENWEHNPPSFLERIWGAVPSLFFADDNVAYGDHRLVPNAETSLEEDSTWETKSYRPEHPSLPDYSHPTDNLSDDTTYGPWQKDSQGREFRVVKHADDKQEKQVVYSVGMSLRSEFFPMESREGE